jgi:hypothetical protein
MTPVEALHGSHVSCGRRHDLSRESGMFFFVQRQLYGYTTKSSSINFLMVDYMLFSWSVVGETSFNPSSQSAEAVGYLLLYGSRRAAGGPHAAILGPAAGMYRPRD